MNVAVDAEAAADTLRPRRARLALGGPPRGEAEGGEAPAGGPAIEREATLEVVPDPRLEGVYAQEEYEAPRGGPLTRRRGLTRRR